MTFELAQVNVARLAAPIDSLQLKPFVDALDHLTYLRRRREWFVPITEAHAVCWWVASGHRPTTGDAEDRVRHRRAHGSTGHAFDLRSPRPSPGAAPARARALNGGVGGG